MEGVMQRAGGFGNLRFGYKACDTNLGCRNRVYVDALARERAEHLRGIARRVLHTGADDAQLRQHRARGRGRCA